MRIASPTAAMAAPTATVVGVGFASQNTTAAKANPRGTRLRASAALILDTRRLGGEPALHRVQYFLHLDVHQTHRRSPAAPQVVALARSIARDDGIGRRPGTVA